MMIESYENAPVISAFAAVLLIATIERVVRLARRIEIFGVHGEIFRNVVRRNGIEPTVFIVLLTAIKSSTKLGRNGPAHGHRGQRLREAEVEVRDLR